MRLSPSQREWLEAVTAEAEVNLNQAASYLAGRGVTEAAARAARLGVAAGRTAGSEKYAGRLTIPYLSRAGVLNVKFRALDDSEPKYLCLSGEKPLLYNVVAFQEPSPVIGICEGEMDALILHRMVGVPAVAVAGVSKWQDHYSRCFSGYERVLVFADPDPAGDGLAKRIRRDVPHAEQVDLPRGMDVNEVFIQLGGDELRKRAGL